MKYICLAVGNLSQGHWKQADAFYKERLRAFQIDLQVKEIDIKTSENALQQKRKEASLITDYLGKLRGETYLIGLDETGEEITSQQLAGLIGPLHHQYKIVFLLGGSWGLDETIKSKCHKMLAFGRLTWPHQMARIMLYEQIYRAHTILKGHPYHKSD